VSTVTPSSEGATALTSGIGEQPDTAYVYNYGPFVSRTAWYLII